MKTLFFIKVLFYDYDNYLFQKMNILIKKKLKKAH